MSRDQAKAKATGPSAAGALDCYEDYDTEEYLATGPSAAGALDCYQDRCEGVPFASVGGLEARAMRAPDYIEDYDAEEYLEGYRAQAAEMFGPDWRVLWFGDRR